MDHNSLKIAAWNLNHRARPRRIENKVIAVIRALEVDVLVLSEFVEADTHESFIGELAECGLVHVSLTGRLEGHNQVLMASRLPHEPGTLKIAGDETHALANFLSISFPELQLELVGLRVPIFKLATENREYWEKFVRLLKPLSQEHLVVIGDMNANANHDASRGGRYLRELEADGWRLARPDGDWSYISAAGTVRASIDHVMAGRPVEIRSARYLHHIAGITVAGPSSVKLLTPTEN